MNYFLAHFFLFGQKKSMAAVKLELILTVKGWSFSSKISKALISFSLEEKTKLFRETKDQSHISNAPCQKVYSQLEQITKMKTTFSS